ncbi:MAG TPA: RDD family protein [Burkholderiales bacterium]|nr:RDD family protein [Burkholderiales bacterium]
MYAGFWNRFAAALLDLLVLLLPVIVVPVVVALITGPKSNATAIADVSMLALVWLYFAGMECSPKQATLGKIAFGIRVVDLDGNRIGFVRASARLLAKLLSAATLGIGFLMAGLTSRKQALHDKIAGCVVVNREAPAWRFGSGGGREVTEGNRGRFPSVRGPARLEPEASAGPIRRGARGRLR